MPRLQTILTTGPGLRTSQITCTQIKAGMFTSAIRMATTKTSRTGKPSKDRRKTGSNLLPVSNLPPVRDLPPVSNPLLVSSHALNRARCKATSGNKWTGPIRTGVRGHKTITVHNSISNKTGADQAAQAVGGQEDPGPPVAGGGKWDHVVFCYYSAILAGGPFVFFRFDQSLIE